MTKEIDRKIKYAEKLITEFVGFKGTKFIKGVEKKNKNEIQLLTNEGNIFLIGNINEEFTDYAIGKLDEFIKYIK